MGATLVYGKLFELLGHQVIMPPRPTRHTIDLGVKYAPEFACFPLKVILGTYLEAIELGADTLVTTGGNGPCRAGYYGEVHKKIIENLGIDVEVIVLDEPKRDWRGFLQKLLRLKGENSWREVYQIIQICFRLAQSVDQVERQITCQRAYVLDKPELNRLHAQISAEYQQVKTVADIEAVEQRAFAALKRLPVQVPPADQRIKIGIIGEIFVVIEASINYELEELLNSYGVETERSHYISDWAGETLRLCPDTQEKAEDILKKGEPYIEIIIGGHAKQSVGHIVDYKERGFDGVIHVKPFGCLPEIVVQSMLDKLSQTLDIPIISLSIDEQMAEANTITRIEAFLELIKRRKAAFNAAERKVC